MKNRLISKKILEVGVANINKQCKILTLAEGMEPTKIPC